MSSNVLIENDSRLLSVNLIPLVAYYKWHGFSSAFCAIYTFFCAVDGDFPRVSISEINNAIILANVGSLAKLNWRRLFQQLFQFLFCLPSRRDYYRALTKFFRNTTNETHVHVRARCFSFQIYTHIVECIVLSPFSVRIDTAACCINIYINRKRRIMRGTAHDALQIEANGALIEFYER